MIIDVHVHLIGHLRENGCFVHPRMMGGITYRFLIRYLGLQRVAPDRLDQAYRDQLLHMVERSGLDAVGLLALDAVYDHRGEPDLERTNVWVGNDYCLEVCRASDKLLPVCSVNPQRKDALDELERVHALGTVALKIVPNSQAFNPADARYEPFWQRMGDLGLPLLSHTSFEHTIHAYDQTFGRPERLRPALDSGVTVIAAHCAAAGVTHLREDIGTWMAMLEEHPNLYGDISSMVSPARFPYIRRILDHGLARQRVMLGSDFPVPIWPALFLPRLGISKVRELTRIRNPLQRNLDAFRAMGVDDDILERGASVVRLSPPRHDTNPGIA